MTTLSLIKSLSLATAGTVAVVIVALKPVYAASVLLFNPATGEIGNSNNQSVGWQFDVNTPVKVTDLQWYDENADGLDVGHSVGIWNPEGTLLSSVFIPSGTSTLLLDSLWRTVAVSPFTLTPGQGYIIGGENYESNSERLALNTVGDIFNPDISFVNATFSNINTALERPTIFSSATSGFYGPSFTVSTTAVPEPSSILGTAVAGVFGCGFILKRKMNPLNPRSNSRSD